MIFCFKCCVSVLYPSQYSMQLIHNNIMGNMQHLETEVGQHLSFAAEIKSFFCLGQMKAFSYGLEQPVFN